METRHHCRAHPWLERLLQHVSADDSDSKTNSRTSSYTFEYEDSVVVTIDSTKKSSKDSDDEDSKDTSSKSSNNDSDSSDSTDQGIYSSNAPTPVVSAIIFQNNAAKEEYEFELVVHGNYIKQRHLRIQMERRTA